jgi:hypothetical protein
MVACITERMSNGFLRPGLCASEKTLADGGEAETGGVRRAEHLALRRIGGGRTARPALAGRHVGVLVVAQEHAAGRGEIGGVVLRLPVRAHDLLVAADAEVVVGGDAARVVERALAGQHHRALAGHDQDAPGVRQHGRLGVPVGLRADVDAVDHHVDLVARLRVLDDVAQDSEIQSMFSLPLSMAMRAPAESANHSTGSCSRRASASAAMMRRHSGSASAPMSRLGSPRTITRAMPSGCLAVKLRITPTTRLARFSPRGRATGTSASPPGARSCSWNSPGGRPATRLPQVARQHGDDLVGVRQAELAQAHHLLRVAAERLDGVGGRVAHHHGHLGAAGVVEVDDAVAQRAALVRHPGADEDALQAEPVAGRGQAPDQGVHLAGRQGERRAQEELDAVPPQPLARRAAGLLDAHGGEALDRGSARGAAAPPPARRRRGWA